MIFTLNWWFDDWMDQADYFATEHSHRFRPMYLNIGTDRRTGITFVYTAGDPTICWHENGNFSYWNTYITERLQREYNEFVFVATTAD